MAFNIMDLVKEQVSDSIMDQMGGLLGENSDMTRTAIGGAIPAILSGLAGVAGDNKGAESVFNAINDHDDGLLDSLGDLLGGDQSGSMIEMGTKVLGGLMGNSGLGSIIGALTGFSGMGKKSSSSLVGLLAPIVIGIIKRKVFGGGGDGTIGALTSLFTGQKDNIASAMPSGMNDQLSSSGFFDRISADVIDSGKEAVQEVQAQVSDAASGGVSKIRKFLPIIIIAAIAWFAMKMFGGGGEMQAPPETTTSMEAPDFGKQIGSIFENTTGTLTRITDIETATAELPNLKNIVTDVDNFSGAFVGLNDEVRAPVITLAKDAFKELEPVVGKVLEIEGVGDLLKPTTDSLLEKLNQLMK
jgi:hypothetical protein